MTTLTAGFLFGLLAYHGWLFWGIFGIILFFESLALCRKVDEEELGVATALLILVLCTIHIGGLVDVINLVRYNYIKVLEVVGVYLAIGLMAYAPIAGWLTAFCNRKKFAQKLRDEKESWIRSKRYEAQEKLNCRVLSEAQEAKFLLEVENEWKNGIKAKTWEEIISVEKDKNRILRWTVFWPFHLIWHVVFRWVVHIEDLFDIIWARIRSVAQVIKSSALHGADKDI